MKVNIVHLGPKLPCSYCDTEIRGAQFIAAHEHLTMTGLYNALERYREVSNGCAVSPLSEAEKDTHQAGLISVQAQLHDDIDRAVLSAYGWEDLIPGL